MSTFGGVRRVHLGIRSTKRLARLCGLFAIAAIACAPQTVTRRSAFVPPPAPPIFSGKPLPVGKTEITAAATPLFVGVDKNLFPKIGDAGLYVPNTQYQLALRFGLGGLFDIGLLAQWAPWAGKQASAVGVPPLPSASDLFGFGFSVRAGAAGVFHRKLFAGIAIEGTSRSIPYAVWECSTCTNDYSYSPATYTLKSQGRDQFWDYSFSAVLAWDNMPVTTFIFAGLSSTIQNIGFDPKVSASSTLEHGSPMPMIGAGAEATFGRLRLMGMIYFPIAREPVGYFPLAASFSVGLLL